MRHVIRDTEGRIVSHFARPQYADSGAMLTEPITEEALAAELAPTLDDLKAAKIVELNAACEAELSVLRAKYPESEVLSWDKQESEARAWVADNNAPTPLVDIMAAERQMDHAELIDRIIQKADQYTAMVGQVVGKRQWLEDQVALAQTEAELHAISW